MMTTRNLPFYFIFLISYENRTIYIYNIEFTVNWIKSYEGVYFLPELRRTYVRKESDYTTLIQYGSVDS